MKLTFALKTKIDSEEIVLRSVPDKPPFIKRNDEGALVMDINGKPYISPQAFSDRLMQPSLDRACKLESHVDCKHANDDGVLKLSVLDINKIKDLPDRSVWVLEDAIGIHTRLKDNKMMPENMAHAIVFASPRLSEKEKRAFDKLKIALSNIATWSIEPTV